MPAARNQAVTVRRRQAKSMPPNRRSNRDRERRCRQEASWANQWDNRAGRCDNGMAGSLARRCGLAIHHRAERAGLWPPSRHGSEPIGFSRKVQTVGCAIGSGRPWAFTDRHAELGYAIYATDVAQESI